MRGGLRAACATVAAATVAALNVPEIVEFRHSVPSHVVCRAPVWAKTGHAISRKSQVGRAPQNDSLPRRASRDTEVGKMLQTYEGGCHCGRVRFRIRVDLEQSTVGECNCSICTKKGIL